MILCLETATTLCSVALCNDTIVIASRDSNDKKSHAALLTVFISEIMKEAGIRTSDLDAVAVSSGPGSYTGLRIGISVAKGLAFAASIPLIGVKTPFSMFNGIREKYSNEKDLLFCPVIDARRMEVYYAIYDNSGNIVKDIDAEIIEKNTFRSFLKGGRMLIFGDGAEKLKVVLDEPGYIFDDRFTMSAAHLAIPAAESFRSRKFEDIAYFEPLYLKDFIATKSSKNILGL